MPTENPRITFTLSDEMRSRIDEYRFDNRVKNQTMAIVNLINMGLQVVGNKTIVINESDISLAETKRIPILGDTAAGQPIVANREYDEYVDIPLDGRHFDAALHVTGDSMEPNYHIGDLAIIRYQEDVDDGQVAVICLDEEVTLKRVFRMKNGILLQSDNRKYPPMVVTKKDYSNIHLVGKVIGAIHWEE